MTTNKQEKIQAPTGAFALEAEEMNFIQHPTDCFGSQAIAFLGLLGFLAAWWVAALFKIHDVASLLVDFFFLTSLPMVVVSIVWNKVHLRKSTGLASESSLPNASRCRIKFIGFLGTLSAIGALYCLIPEYSRPFYEPFWRFILWIVFPLLGITLPYISWIDKHMIKPEDGGYHCGLLLCGKWSKVDYQELSRYLLGWLVKGFFMPFMIAGTAQRLDLLANGGVDFSTFGRLYATFVNLAFSIDIVFGAIGYLLTLRVIDSHIQSVEPTLLGWMCTLVCYAPFSTFTWMFIKYNGKTNWSDWLAPHPILYLTWGFVIIMLHSIYFWSTCSFGYRFSNLTNRGIIVNGPYRHLKHPAYVSKNLVWWFMSVPFVSHATLVDSIRACLCLLLLNLIYCLRALTEERHLSRDPAYRAYSAWMEEHGSGAQLRGIWNKLCGKALLVPE